MSPAGAVKIQILKHLAACQYHKYEQTENLYVNKRPKEEKKQKEKDNRYKTEKPMAISIGLNIQQPIGCSKAGSLPVLYPEQILLLQGQAHYPKAD